ncbi:MAG: hypothetical protein RMI94_00995 [Bryobacterales bacterium]|nr:hypothetical protein [Bryobacteraceae bacterium]MDW8129098.1 hypothetical protein [Bryobacterales bacterium]
MRQAVLMLALVSVAGAAVRGTVVNRTTGKPAAGLSVRLLSMGSAGMQELESAVTDAQGRFAFSRTAQAVHYLVETQFGGVTYNRMVSPGDTAREIELVVYEVARRPAPRPTQRIVILEPASDELRVSETWLFRNDGNRTLYDPQSAALRFWVPEAAAGKISVSVTAPGGMPLSRSPESGPDGVYRVNFPIKPGETRFDVSYSLAGQRSFSGRMLFADVPVRLVVPGGVTLEGEGLEVLGPDPSGRTMIYELKGRREFTVAISGSGLLEGAEEGAGPSLDRILPAVYDRLAWILAPAAAALALGFLLLYRAPATARRGGRTSRS